MKKTIKKTLIFGPPAIVALALLFVGWNLVFPSMSKLKTENPKTTSFMAYRQAQLKAKGQTKNLTQLWVPMSQISPYLVNAVIISEDDLFWQHKGFDWKAIKEAYEQNRIRKEVHFGGSTITQQLAKNLFLSSSRSILRKAREAILTWRLERVLTKNRILELYLNVVEWGDGIYGVEAASAYYYQTHAINLTPDEAARLAAVLPQPRRYTPAKIRNSDYLMERSQEILAIMRKRGVLKLDDQEPLIDPLNEPDIIKEQN
jgi:monofunctional glycosyltransferase